MKKNITRIAVVLAVGGALALTACTGSGGGGGAGEAFVDTDTIRTTIDIPATFDPMIGLSLPDFMAARTSFDTLLRKDDSGLVPGLAASYESTPNSTTLMLREGPVCSDGTPITASVVKNSLDAFAASNGSLVPQTFGSQTPKISADDAAGTVTIDLESPWAYLPEALSTSATGIVCPTGLADPEGLAAGHVEGAESGPYVLAKTEPGVRYTYELREDYDWWPEWTTDIAGKPAKTLEYVVSPDTSATTNLVFDGQLDVAKVMPESMDRFEGKEGYAVTPFLFSDYYLIFNEREGSPFTDPALRKAVTQGIDREALNAAAMNGIGEVSLNLSSSATPCVTEASPAIIPTDPAAAAKALNGVKIRIVAPLIIGANGSGNTYIQEALRAAGAEVELQNVDVGTWISTVFAQPGDWDMTVYADLNFLGSLASPIGTFGGPTPDAGGPNIGATVAPEAEALATQARGESNEEARCGTLNAATDVLIGEAHTAPLITDKYVYATRPGYEVRMLGGSLDDHIVRIVG